MKTVVGIDYGTQSARAILVDASTGAVLLSHSIAYPHGVMPGDLASAEDYENALIDLLAAVTPEAYRASVACVCVDATSLTLVPVDEAGRVLCQTPGLEDHPHAQIKLWKRHTAQAQADEALALAREMHQPFLGRSGGTISCEWTLPKLLEMRDEAPDVYARMDRALDLCEFLTFRLTGKITRNIAALCYKAHWAQDLGFPDEGYLDALRPGFAAEYRKLLRGEVLRPGECAGYLRPDICRRLGLDSQVRVASGVIDGHTALLALGALKPGDAALVVGTSNVITVQTDRLCEIEGVCGIARDGLAPGLVSIEGGQNCTGDMLEWYIRNALPAQALAEAERRGISPHQLLCEGIERPWENRVVAADWWNGSRNAPCDLTLPGALVGLTLTTEPKDIYLALLQSIACGTREIIEQCCAHGAQVRRVLATGGVTSKNPLLMQEYANLLGRPVHVGQCAEGPAMGSAILAAVAAGIYQTPYEAHAAMGVKDFVTYEPEAEHREAYERLYQRNHALRTLIQQMKA